MYLRKLPFRSLALSASLALATAAPADAQTFELTSGEVVIGTVVDASASGITLQTGYPEAAVRRIAREDLVPRSFYGALTRHSAPATAADHKRLAAIALEIGLPLHAQAQLREIVRLAPERAGEIERRVAEIRADMAAALLAKAEQNLAAGKPATAKLEAEVVVYRYPNSAAAERARSLVDTAMEQLRAAEGQRAVDARTLAAARKKASRHIAAANKVGVTLTGGFRTTSVEKNKRERAIRHVEKAWKTVSRLGPDATVPADQADEFVAERKQIRDTLGQHYLGIGAVLVQRLALPSAEDYNAKACALDPESSGCRDLQSLIIQARISRGIGF